MKLRFGAGDWTCVFEEGVSVLVHAALGSGCKTYINDGVLF